MKIKLLSIFILTFTLFISCNKETEVSGQKTISLVALGKVDDSYLKVVSKSVENFYGYKCITKNAIPLTQDLLAKSKTRYDASKILTKFNSKENILLITEKDIAYHDKKRNVSEWGILGLGLRPGKIAVISTFRMKKNASQKLIYNRLEKVAIHEIGHNLSLEHCTQNPKCLMNSANGSIKQVDRELFWLCPDCKKKIRLKNS